MTRAVLAIALLLAGVAYPFFVHANLQNGAARWLLLPLAGLWLARALADRKRVAGGWLLPAIVTAFCAIVVFLDDARWLRGYPVLVNAAMFAVFASSLWRGMPVVERFARLRHPELPPHAVAYTRRVTQVWAAFFALNGLTSAALSLWAPWHWWTLYNGVISYVLIGLLMAGEWLVRPAPGKQAAAPVPVQAMDARAVARDGR
ncbi:DNA gyrase subunit B [Bordetella sputigena]|uniref:COG4648 family protein n=1 Tax=Bordetella sputigena TaxID=1416810 RepID=UPI0039EEA466